MSGWIKLHRKIRHSAIFNNLQLYRLWTICLLEAAHKEREQMIGTQTVRLMPGQFVTGRFDLREMYNNGLKTKDKIKGEKTIYRWLEALEKDGFLTIKKTNKYSIVTIDNWGFYQENDEMLDRSLTTKRPSNDHQMTTNKNVKNVKKKHLVDFSDFIQTFSPGVRALIGPYWEIVSRTRKNNKIADTVKVKAMQEWLKFDEVVVQYALRKHINDLGDTRGEKYTIGIMRNTNRDEAMDKLNTKEAPTFENRSEPIAEFDIENLFKDG